MDESAKQIRLQEILYYYRCLLNYNNMKTRYGYSKINIIISVTVVITCDLFYIAIILRTPIIYLNTIKNKKNTTNNYL